MSNKARRVSIDVIYQGVNITDDIAKDLLSFEYVDNASKESDSVSVSIKDESHIWLKHWFPEKGDTINPTLKTYDWNRPGDNQILPCGKFIVDEPGYSGRPSILNLNAISSPVNSNFKDVNRSKIWNNITLNEIAKDISGRAGLNLNFLSGYNPLYTIKEQSETPDSSFLSELCEEEGLAMKITDSKIIIFSEEDFEGKSAITTYNEWEDVVISYSFETKLVDTKYSGVKVKYLNSTSGELIEYLYNIQGSTGNKIYNVNKRVNSVAEAMKVAQHTAIKLNKKETTCSLTVVGNIELLGSVNINLNGFGPFSGKYYIEKATHSIGSGYVTSFLGRKVG